MDVDSSTKFIESLTKFLQSLCNGYVDFQKGVELVGHIYLSIDTGEKVDYILHERVSKNDENSVTFVSNSFHAQPLDKDKSPTNKDVSCKPNDRGYMHASDDDDIMIVDQTKGTPTSTNVGSIPARGMKRVGSPGADQRQGQRMRTMAGPSGHSQSSNSQASSGTANRQHMGRLTTGVSSQGGVHEENLNMSDVKLEQITGDDLLSLATHVGEGGPGPSHSMSSSSRSHPPHSSLASAGGGRGDRSVYIKQEKPDEEGDDTGWSHGRDDSNSNSGSNLYPVMLHQNSGAYSGPVFPGFPGHNASGVPSAANPFSNPLPGTSQDLSGFDPTEREEWKRRPRTMYSQQQVNALEKEFELGHYVSPQQRYSLARLLGLTERHVAIWFQNRRQKWKKERNQSGASPSQGSSHSLSPGPSLLSHDPKSALLSLHDPKSASLSWQDPKTASLSWPGQKSALISPHHPKSALLSTHDPDSALLSTHDLKSASHDPKSVLLSSHDPKSTLHDPKSSLHDPKSALHDSKSTSHDPESASVSSNDPKSTSLLSHDTKSALLSFHDPKSTSLSSHDPDSPSLSFHDPKSPSLSSHDPEFLPSPYTAVNVAMFSSPSHTLPTDSRSDSA